jgi:hypothetical protein
MDGSARPCVYTLSKALGADPVRIGFGLLLLFVGELDDE